SKTAAGTTWQFQERAVIVTSKAGKMVTYPYRTDTAKTPTQIDVQPAAGVGLQRSKQGIIQIDGATLKICFVQPTVKGVERPRPTAFMTMPGDGCIFYVMKRVK